MFGRVHEYVMWNVIDILNVPVNVRHFYAIFPSCTRGSLSSVFKRYGRQTNRKSNHVGNGFEGDAALREFILRSCSYETPDW